MVQPAAAVRRKGVAAALDRASASGTGVRSRTESAGTSAAGARTSGQRPGAGKARSIADNKVAEAVALRSRLAGEGLSAADSLGTVGFRRAVGMVDADSSVWRQF